MKYISNLKSQISNSSGQSIIELLIAFGLCAILLPALLTGLVASREGKAQEGQRIQAAAYLREAAEVGRNLRKNNWSTLTDGTFHPIVSGTSWGLAVGPENVSGFTRQIVISAVLRDNSGQIVTSGGVVDPSTKQVVSSVSWSSPQPQVVSNTEYLTRTQNNTSWTQTTQAQLNLGTKINTEVTNTLGGEVVLTTTSGTANYGNKFTATAVSSIGSMTTSTMRTSLRFTAQNSKTVNAVRVYLQTEAGTSPNYRFGLQANSGGNPSGTYLGSGTLTSTSTGWKTVPISPSVTLTSGTVYHLVVQYNSGTVNSSNNIALRRSTPQNSLYPLTNVPDTQANTLFYNGTSWATQNFQPLYELDFSDSTFEGNPYESNTETSIFGVNFIGEKFTIAGGDKTATSITFMVRRNGTPTQPLLVELRNSANSVLATGTLAGTTFSTTYSLATFTFSSSQVLTNGATYRIVLRNSTGTSTNNYRVQRLNTTNAANFTGISWNGTTSVYTSSANSGSSWTDTSSSDIGNYFFVVTSVGGYSPTGSFESSSLDTGNTTSAFNNFLWTGTTPANTSLNFQLAINTDNTTWNWFGPDGTSGTFYAVETSIPLNKITGRYLRVRGYFTSDGTATPQLNDYSVNYTP